MSEKEKDPTGIHSVSFVGVEAKIEKAFADESLQKLYTNGFIVGHGGADAFILFELNGSSNLLMNLSFSAIKSLSIELNSMVARFESDAQQSLMSIADIKTKTLSKK